MGALAGVQRPDGDAVVSERMGCPVAAILLSLALWAVVALVVARVLS